VYLRDGAAAITQGKQYVISVTASPDGGQRHPQQWMSRLQLAAQFCL
jgi:hypothetical protein